MMIRKMPEYVKRELAMRRNGRKMMKPFKSGGIILPKPHIKLQHYPKSKRSYWRVSPVPVKWSDLSASQKAQWDAAHKFKERLNSQRIICPHCGKEY
jgi:hypothetical protein